VTQMSEQPVRADQLNSRPLGCTSCSATLCSSIAGVARSAPTLIGCSAIRLVPLVCACEGASHAGTGPRGAAPYTIRGGLLTEHLPVATPK
jgi:hypothetical protein